MRVLIVDNYDSFTYNLYQLVGEVLQSQGQNFVLDVVRNNQISLNEIKKRNYDRIIISPGPGNPSNQSYFGVCGEVLTGIGRRAPVLGVCLGMQGLAHFYGGKVVRAKTPMHGKSSAVSHNGKGLFKSIPQNIEVMRYHSLVVDRKSLSKDLEITASTTGQGSEIMGLRHKKFPIQGIQFHPESYATEYGKQIISNFLL